MRPAGRIAAAIAVIVAKHDGIEACVAHQPDDGLRVNKACVTLDPQDAVAIVEREVGLVFREAGVDAHQQPGRVGGVGHVGFKNFYRHTWYILRFMPWFSKSAVRRPG